MLPEHAVRQAKKTGGTKELRRIACKDPQWAYNYALSVDKKPGWDTYEGVRRTYWLDYYEKLIGKPEYDPDFPENDPNYNVVPCVSLEDFEKRFHALLKRCN